MHSPSIRHDFLRLRCQGVSLAAIGRQLGVSKPTLIRWNRQPHSEIQSRIEGIDAAAHQQIARSAVEELAALRLKYDALKQELLSRSLRDIPTPALETLCGEIRQRIENFELKNMAPSGAEPIRTHPD